MQVGAVHTQNGHHEAADHAQQDAESNTGSQSLNGLVAPHTLADKGREGGCEDGDVDLRLEGNLGHAGEQEGAQNAGPDVQEVHAEEAEADGQEEGHQRNAVQRETGQGKHQYGAKARHAYVQKGAAHGAQLEIVHGQLCGRAEDRPETLQGLGQVAAEQCGCNGSQAVEQHDAVNLLLLGMHRDSSCQSISKIWKRDRNVPRKRRPVVRPYKPSV